MPELKKFVKLLFILLPAALVFSFAATAETPSNPQDVTYDIIFKGGKIMDGTGNPAYYGDIAVRDGEIAYVGDLSGANAGRTIDITGHVIAPGFIDIHTHAEDAMTHDEPKRRAAPSDVMQGVTSIVINQCGRSPIPLKDQIEEIRDKGTGPNVMALVGHGAVRREVMGNDFRRPATEDEIREMRAIVRQAMEDGASGMSAGLEYVPGRWSETKEVAALVEELVPFGGVFHNHMRSEGTDPMWYWPSQDEPGPPTLLDAVRESIEIAETTGGKVNISHIKVKGAHYWGASHNIIRLINEARERGVDIWADQYTYNTTGTDGSTVLLPPWIRDHREDEENYDELLSRLLAHPEKAEMIRKDIEHEISRRGGENELLILEHPDEELEGKTLRELADKKELSPVETAIEMQMEGDVERFGGALLRGFSLSEYDVENYMKQPWVATASDGRVRVPELDDGFVHPRFYGTFPRKIRHYAMERGVISVEDAIRSSTSLPAQIHGIMDRGLIREGMHADIVVFDPENIGDKATFFEPHQYPEGIEFVMVNGMFVVEDGEPTWELPGDFIKP